MGDNRILYAIAESCPFDSLLIRDMKHAVNSLLQLNLKRFRLPQKVGTKYSSLDIMKQALELLYGFSPSERNYREAMRTIQVYSEGDEEMLHTLQASFYLIANAVYGVFTGQRHVESLAPDILFVQGIPIDQAEVQQSFRFVGVRPPQMSPPSVRNMVFLDEDFEPYKLVLDEKLDPCEAQRGREEHWAGLIEATLSKASGRALIRAGAEHVDEPKSMAHQLVNRVHHAEVGRLQFCVRKEFRSKSFTGCLMLTRSSGRDSGGDCHYFSNEGSTSLANCFILCFIGSRSMSPK